jgi:hypothetical protein
MNTTHWRRAPLAAACCAARRYIEDFGQAVANSSTPPE